MGLCDECMKLSKGSSVQQIEGKNEDRCRSREQMCVRNFCLLFIITVGAMPGEGNQLYN